jgi:methionine aminopeptidase
MAAKYQEYMNIELKAGQIICLEPAITKVDRFGVPSGDGWSWKTRNGHKSAQFEEMIEVLPDGYRILTSHLKEEHEIYLNRK